MRNKHFFSIFIVLVALTSTAFPQYQSSFHIPPIDLSIIDTEIDSLVEVGLYKLGQDAAAYGFSWSRYNSDINRTALHGTTLARAAMAKYKGHLIEKTGWANNNLDRRYGTSSMIYAHYEINDDGVNFWNEMVIENEHGSTPFRRIVIWDDQADGTPNSAEVDGVEFTIQDNTFYTKDGAIDEEVKDLVYGQMLSHFVGVNFAGRIANWVWGEPDETVAAKDARHEYIKRTIYGDDQRLKQYLWDPRPIKVKVAPIEFADPLAQLIKIHWWEIGEGGSYKRQRNSLLKKIQLFNSSQNLVTLIVPELNDDGGPHQNSMLGNLLKMGEFAFASRTICALEGYQSETGYGTREIKIS